MCVFPFTTRGVKLIMNKDFLQNVSTRFNNISALNLKGSGNSFERECPIFAKNY